MNASTAAETSALARVASTAASPSASPSASPAGIATTEWLTFRLGAEEYGIDILCVQEIRSYEAPTRIASMSAHVKGIVNLRGVIVPILDLRLKFGTFEPRYDVSTVTVVLNIGGRVVGVVVDAVSDVLELLPAQVKAFPELSAGIDRHYITGIGSLDTEGHARMLILLDIAALIADTRDAAQYAEREAATA